MDRPQPRNGGQPLVRNNIGKKCATLFSWELSHFHVLVSGTKLINSLQTLKSKKSLRINVTMSVVNVIIVFMLLSLSCPVALFLQHNFLHLFCCCEFYNFFPNFVLPNVINQTTAN